MTADTVPCVKFPEAKTIEIPLPSGVSLKSIADIADGPPTDCSLAHSLMLQITPILASMDCLFKLLDVAAAFAKILPTKPVPPPDPISFLSDLITEVGPKLAALSQCFLMIDPCKIIKLIVGILQIILSYLKCMIEAFDSIFQLKAGIDLDAAHGNPVLLASLQCADDNAASAMTSLSEALEGIQPILEMLNPLLELAGQEGIPTSVETPTLEDLAEGVDPLATVREFVDTLTEIKDTLDAVC